MTELLSRVAVIAIVTTADGASDATLRRLPADVTGVMIRADLVGDVDPERLRRHGSGELIYALRSTSRGGHGPDSIDERRSRLLSAADRFDVVELEAPGDLTAELLARVPAHRRWISWYGSGGARDLRERLASMTRVPARLYVLAPAATTFDEVLAPLRLVARLGRRDVTGFGVGPMGGWSRVLAPWLGAPVAFGRVEQTSMVSGGEQDAPTVDQLLTDYPFPALPPLHNLYGIVGRSINTSLFQNRFNTAFGELGLPGLFLPFTVPDEDSFRTRFWPAVADGGFDELGVPVRGLTVMAPYKQIALETADAAHPPARASRAVNLLLHRRDGWLATTTDGSALMAVLRARGQPIRGRRVAVVGCGGAGRAVVAALVSAGAAVTIVNRDSGRGRAAAELFGVEFTPLERFGPAGYVVVVNATPVGAVAMEEDTADGLLFDIDPIASDAVVVDFVCASRPTALITAARRRGLCAISGQHILESELAQQFPLMTGRMMPTAAHTVPPVQARSSRR